MSVAIADKAAHSKLAVLRIAPSQGWWQLPFSELWDYRELLYFIVWRDIKIRYKQTAIGAAWAVLQPFLTMLVFSLFFGKLAHVPSEGMPYPIFYYSALLPWMYFAAALQNATNAIVENQRVITKVYFPRVALPLAAVLASLVDFGISFLMFVALMIYYGIHLTGAVIWFPAFLLLAVLTALGVGTVALGAECHLPGCALRDAVRHSILDVRFAGGVSEFACAGKVALALRTESDGGRDRGVPVVACGARQRAGRHDGRLRRGGRADSAGRAGVFSAYGDDRGGRGVNECR
jgi:hypothetical protein